MSTSSLSLGDFRIHLFVKSCSVVETLPYALSFMVALTGRHPRAMRCEAIRRLLHQRSRCRVKLLNNARFSRQESELVGQFGEQQVEALAALITSKWNDWQCPREPVSREALQRCLKQLLYRVTDARQNSGGKPTVVLQWYRFCKPPWFR